MATYKSAPSGDDVAGSKFFKKFLASAEGYLKQPTRLKKLLTDAYAKASEKKELGTLAHEAWETLQSLFRLIKLSISGEYTELPTSTVVGAVAVLIYFISPIDLIPDFFPVIGLLDDMALIAWFSTSIKHELDKFHAWEQAKAATVANPDQFTSNRLSMESTNQSAKNTGTSPYPTAPAGTGQSATDAGLGSPSSSTSPTSSITKPISDVGPDGPLPEPTNESAKSAGVDDIANVSDGSRDGNVGQHNDAGGNVR
ncbi:MAG TPA: YkvA family protein [Hymenobacter sp.]|uniref:YkvA family protein n=1 Tax=Hymenobacter sp. TaxID=1898978 RepID=UPI002D80A3C2|nr:YkvA family protein [Hymenobacter sp.]HET9503968.1 YkvA family protein [Hymenobacter sp.]